VKKIIILAWNWAFITCPTVHRPQRCRQIPLPPPAIAAFEDPKIRSNNYCGDEGLGAGEEVIVQQL